MPTLNAKANAITASCNARLKYGRPLPYSAVNPPIDAINPADVSPVSHPVRIGAPIHTAARNENHTRPAGAGRNWNRP
ncbi:hypothetical protein GCM10011487_31850 [Steroidobacter agaridevorans]|uniref:Uncharacterized protein n=1 Tax=Steroidobacter agaridevorans TaxID=2695856 RepID=A0A829YD58_9GAMM|nr:hypothetical protein GCM10011487_31850 [Steroidobacter agaridevorans]